MIYSKSRKFTQKYKQTTNIYLALDKTFDVLRNVCIQIIINSLILSAIGSNQIWPKKKQQR